MPVRVRARQGRSLICLLCLLSAIAACGSRSQPLSGSTSSDGLSEAGASEGTGEGGLLDCQPGSYPDKTCSAPACLPFTPCNGWEESEEAKGTTTSDRICQTSNGVRQFRDEADTYALSGAVDSEGNVIVAGSSRDYDENNEILEPDQGILQKYDSKATLLWERRLGEAVRTLARDVAVDSKGDILVVGSTEGSVEGENQGQADAYLRKYSGRGEVLFSRQLGGERNDSARVVAVDGHNNIYVDVETSDYGVISVHSLYAFDSTGNEVLRFSFDAQKEVIVNAMVIAPDGPIYLAGETPSSFGGKHIGYVDALLMRFDPGGELVWARQFGTKRPDRILAVSVDSDKNVWIAGEEDFFSDGWMIEGRGFIGQYDADGNRKFFSTLEGGHRQSVQALAVPRGCEAVAVNLIFDDTTPTGLRSSLIEIDTKGKVLSTEFLDQAFSLTGPKLAHNTLGKTYLVGTVKGRETGPFGSQLHDIFVMLVR